MQDWKKRVQDLFWFTGMQPKSVTETIEKEFGLENMYWKVYRVIQKMKNERNNLNEQLDKIVDVVKEADFPVYVNDISATKENYPFDFVINNWPPVEEAIREGLDELANNFKKEKKPALQNFEPKVVKSKWDGTKVLKFAIMGDTQLGSKYAQITYLHQFYDLCVKEGVTDVYHTGDITDGIKMRPGHEYELYASSADDMLDDVVKNYPRREGITTHFITGNHDASLYKHVGYDIGKAIDMARDDMVYLGRDWAKVYLTPNCVLELRHPWDGSAYSLSYKPQKMIEAMESDSKPNILAIGHYHKAEYLFYRNVHALQTGCFQSQTPFTRGKGISVHLGGWIVTIRVDENGYIQGFAPEYVPFYYSIPEDYKNFR